MKCAKCGNALQAGEQFCGECGTPVTVVTPSPIAVPPVTAPYPVRQSVTPPPVMPPPPPPPAASRRGLMLALSGVGVVGGLGFLTYVRATPVPFWVPSTPTPVPTPGPKRLIVDASGSGDYKTIASAILGARPQDTIILRPGTYKEAPEIDHDVQIVGEGGRSKVIVEATSGGYVFTLTGGSATLTGLTIRIVGTGPVDQTSGAIYVRAGTPVIDDCDLTSSAGSAVYILGAGANPTIRNCTMRNSRDYGVFVSEQGQGTVEKCVISGNAKQGVRISEGGNPTVRDCEIRENWESGVFVLDQGQGTIEQCVISGNAKSGVAIGDGGNPTVRGCQIRDNKGAGVQVYEQGKGTTEQCLISGNAYSGVQITAGGNPTVRGCQIRDNKGAGVGVLDQGLGTIEQCVISGNALAGVIITTSGNPTVRDCQIRDGKQAGVYVYDQGQGTFTGNTLTGNAIGAWNIGSTAGRVTRTGNRPNA